MIPQTDPQRHLIVGLSGPELLGEEQRFLHTVQPVGVILFGRNITSLSRLQALVHAVRASSDPPPTLWLDQEGGRVQRLRDPFSRFPSPGAWQGLFLQDPQAACERVRLSGWLNAVELAVMGIGVNCAPVLDIRETEADPVIGARAFGDHPDRVVPLAGAWLSGFNGNGVMAVGKHFPGHGAARVDSHKALPVIHKDREALMAWELVPFRQLLSVLPAIMTAHLVVSGVDAAQPATWSPALIGGILRAEWGYDGLVVSDALEMGALSGSLSERAQRAILSGCDLVLCCTGRLSDGQAALEGITQGLSILPAKVRERSARRIAQGLAPFRPEPGDPHRLLADSRYGEVRREVETATVPNACEPDPTELMIET